MGKSGKREGRPIMTESSTSSSEPSRPPSKKRSSQDPGTAAHKWCQGRTAQGAGGGRGTGRRLDVPKRGTRRGRNFTNHRENLVAGETPGKP